MASTSQSVGRNQFYDDKKKSIVCIYSETKLLVGGGVFVQVGSRQLILTAAHVVYDRSDLEIVCFDDTRLGVEVDTSSRTDDLALLRIVGKYSGNFPCLKVSDMEMVPSSPIHFIGHPGGLIYTHNIGKVSCVAQPCGHIYTKVLCLRETPHFNKPPNPGFIDDFLGLSPALELVQVKNLHGGGRFGGTGAPFLDKNGDIVVSVN